MKPQKNRMVNSEDFVLPKDYVYDDQEKLKLVFKLAYMITDRMKEKLSHTIKQDDPEVWCLYEVLTKKEVEVMLSFKKTRKNLDLEEVAGRNRLSLEETKEILDHLCWIGTVETNRENADKHIQYDVPIFVPGIAEFMMMNQELLDEHPNIASFFNYMTQLPLEGVTQMVPLGGSGVGMHVIPVEKAISAINETHPVEHISHWLEKYDGKIAAGVCTCRRQQKMRNEGDGTIEQECCLGLGDLAEWCVNTNRGHYISKEEALQIIERSERHGFVHQTTNIDGEDKIVGLCNCAPGVCNALRTSQLYNTPNMSRSAYRAHVDHTKCVACGKCVEVCPTGAAKLGQKLCTHHGKVEYAFFMLPDERRMSANEWNPNYREDAKVNCYPQGTAPCKATCPAHIAVQGYVHMAREGRYLDALKLIKKDNPFPAVCGAVCNRRCEDVCTRGTIDEPIAIDEIKKFIAAQELQKESRYIPLCETDHGGMWGEEYKMAVIGAGPAGMSCAYYLRERGYDVTVFEKEARPGGMLMNGIPSFRLGKDVLQAEIDVLKEMGVTFVCNTEIGKDKTIQDLRNEGYKAFYVAIGLQGGRKINVKGEDALGVTSGIEFLKKLNQDHTLKLDGSVIVIGGGNVAIDVARSANRATDGHITIVCLEEREDMPASKEEVLEASDEGIALMSGWGPKEILKDEAGKVQAVIFKRCKSVKDTEGHFNPQYDENETMTITCDNVLLAVGQSADYGKLFENENVELIGQYIKADPITFQTSTPDIFVGGDIYHGAKFAIDAIAEGKLASESLHRYVHPGQSLTIARDLRQFRALDTSDVEVASYDTAHRESVRKIKTEDRFKDDRLAFSEEQVQKEARRCLGCGACVVDLNRCIGCGLCTTKCEFDAIHLSRDLPDASRMRKSEDKMKYIAPYAIKRGFKILLNGKKH